MIVDQSWMIHRKKKFDENHYTSYFSTNCYVAHVMMANLFKLCFI